MEIASFGAEGTMWIRSAEIKKVIQEYTKNQLQEDILHDQIDNEGIH